MASKDFNYQVALKEGLKSLEQGRLRQAEQSFRYLVDKFPGAEGGYRGLAKVHFEQEDRAGALRVLRDGAGALTKSGERSAAIGLLRQAITLDPRDLGTHRKLAAALALAGDTDASLQEYARFIRDLRDNGETDGQNAGGGDNSLHVQDTRLQVIPIPARQIATVCMDAAWACQIVNPRARSTRG